MKDKSIYAKLANFGRELLDRVSTLEQGLPMIADYAKEVITADRCSIYIYSPKTKMLWTTLADGIEKIMISADEGIAGSTLQEEKPVIVNNPYKDDRFLQKIDHQTGYITKNIASVPVFDSNRKVIGVLQLLNKDGDFTEEDTRFMVFFAHYISGYLELATLFREDEAYLLKTDKR
ncbi:MAG: GAF domain-containing protein [Sulfurimonadaceae bacterium]|nr:GAF domain-containing protein [Sulfurimonadaceae bacterium]